MDYTVLRLGVDGQDDLTTEAKRVLTGFLTMDMATDRGTTPLQTCLGRAAQTLAQSFEGPGSQHSPSLVLRFWPFPQSRFER